MQLTHVLMQRELIRPVDFELEEAGVVQTITIVILCIAFVAVRADNAAHIAEAIT